MTSSITCFAPAKINLYLHITGKRDDGYHELDSLAVFADVGDTVTVQPNRGLSLNITGPHGTTLPNDSDNLVLQAAQRLADHVHVPANAAITLDKHLPVARAATERLEQTTADLDVKMEESENVSGGGCSRRASCQ